MSDLQNNKFYANYIIKKKLNPLFIYKFDPKRINLSYKSSFFSYPLSDYKYLENI